MFFCNLCKTQPDAQFFDPRQNMVIAKSAQKEQNRQSEQRNQILIIASKYDSLLEKCIQEKKKFVDEQFRPHNDSLRYSQGQRKIEWKRISQLQPNCIMVVDNEVDINGIKSYISSNTQFVTAVLCVADNPERIQNIFADNFVRNQQGIYKVIVNVNGVPRQMVIDDFIPVFQSSGKPVFCKINNRQMWMVLLEKAYAKVKGSYGSISKNINVQDVFETFLIGPIFNYSIQQKINQKFENELWSNLLKSCVFDAPICTGSKKSQISQIGLDNHHTYQIVNCLQIPLYHETVKMIRIRNIWSQSNYRSKASIYDNNFWQKVPAQYKEIILPTTQFPNEFTIPYFDFLHYFSFLSICHIRKGFNYQFYQAKGKAKEPYFFNISIKKQQQIYISFKIKLHNISSKVKYIRVVLALKKQNKYVYIASKIQTQWNNITVQAQVLPGQYIVLLQSDSNDKSQQYDINFGFFNNSNRVNHHIEPAKNMNKYDKQKFIVKVLLNESEKSEENRILLADNKSWLKYKTLFQEGGYAYIIYHKGQSTQYKINITLQQASIIKNGFTLKYTNESYYQSQKEDLIYIFSYNFNGQDVSDIEFPPKGFRIKSLV